MTETDCTIILEILLAEDIATQQRIARLHELAQYTMREAPTAELRTEARLRVLDIERMMEVSK